MATLTLKKNGVDVEVRADTPQLPAGLHGAHSLNGIPMIARQVDLGANINPATGQPYVQVMSRPAGGMISPPARPGKRFDGRD